MAQKLGEQSEVRLSKVVQSTQSKSDLFSQCQEASNSFDWVKLASDPKCIWKVSGMKVIDVRRSRSRYLAYTSTRTS